MAEQNVVNVDVTDSGFLVRFPYDRELVNKINKVPDAEFDKDADVWVVPKSSEEALDKALESMHFEARAIEKDRDSIMELAKASANEAMKNNGTAGVSAQISDFRKIGKLYSGEIVNVNGRFAAQFTGFGNENGAAFVTIHRLANLSDTVYKGNEVNIKYNSNGIGEVTDQIKIKSVEEKTKDFDAGLGSSVDGVKVVQAGDKYQVSFDYNPDIQHRLERIADVEFNKDLKVYEVPLTHKEFVIRAVSDMRKEYVTDLSERAELKSVAESHIDGAKLKNAYTKEGVPHSGDIIKVSDRYVLQHLGKGVFDLHRKNAFEQPVKEGQNLNISYKNGRAVAQDRKQEKDKSVGMER